MAGFRRAEAAFAAGDFSRAADLLGKHVESRPSDSKARMKLGLALFEAGRVKDGMKESEQAFSMLGGGNPASLLFALMLAESGDLKRARGIVAKVKEADPENPFAAGIESLLLLKSGEVMEAMGILESRGVFESPLFRAHLLAQIEDCISKAEKGKDWESGYLKTVL